MGGGPRVSVVIADDVAGLRRLLRIALEESRSFEVVGEAADGVEAIMAAEQLMPDLMLLDLSMPRMDGLEALPRLRLVAPPMRLVVLSGLSEEHMGPKAVELGADAFFEKGMAPHELVTRLLAVVDSPPSGPAPASGPELTRFAVRTLG
jgi:DNA-binding NarL/FixJ family response regulator